MTVDLFAGLMRGAFLDKPGVRDVLHVSIMTWIRDARNIDHLASSLR